MKCFIHKTDEAVAVCKKCGKAMCGICSAYTGHSGICPSCIRDRYSSESKAIKAWLRRYKALIIINSVLAALSAALAVWLSVNVGLIALVLLVLPLALVAGTVVLVIKRPSLRERSEFLLQEIEKLNAALNGR